MKNLDKLLEIYFDFRSNPEKYGTHYEEKYKWELLQEVNDHYKKTGRDNLIEFAKLILNKHINLLHYLEVADLKDIISKTPAGIEKAIKILYNEKNPLAGRIDDAIKISKELFQQAGIKKRNKLSLRTVAYMLASIDREKYTFYMSGFIKNFRRYTEIIKDKNTSEGQKYTEYLAICVKVTDEMKRRGYLVEPTILDAQDLMMCLNGYDKLREYTDRMLGFEVEKNKLDEVFCAAKNLIKTKGSANIEIIHSYIKDECKRLEIPFHEDLLKKFDEHLKI